jgi:hypothetical protein
VSPVKYELSSYLTEDDILRVRQILQNDHVTVKTGGPLEQAGLLESD